MSNENERESLLIHEITTDYGGAFCPVNRLRGSLVARLTEEGDTFSHHNHNLTTALFFNEDKGTEIGVVMRQFNPETPLVDLIDNPPLTFKLQNPAGLRVELADRSVFYGQACELLLMPTSDTEPSHGSSYSDGTWAMYLADSGRLVPTSDFQAMAMKKLMDGSKLKAVR